MRICAKYPPICTDLGLMPVSELRTITPGSAPAAEIALDIEEAWRLAVADIVSDHNRRADPAQTEERLPPSQRWAISMLRDPTVALPTGAEDADELLTVPRSSAVRTALSDIQRRLADGHLSRDQAAQAIVDVAGEYGLTVVEPPPPLAPITESDVGVVCWMQVLPTSSALGPQQTDSSSPATEEILG